MDRREPGGKHYRRSTSGSSFSREDDPLTNGGSEYGNSSDQGREPESKNDRRNLSGSSFSTEDDSLINGNIRSEYGNSSDQGREPASKNYRKSYSGSSYSRQEDSLTNGNVSTDFGNLPVAFTSSRYSSGQKQSRATTDELDQIVLDYFNKKYSFRPPFDDWVLPDPDVMFTSKKWEVKRLQILKKELNEVKSKLDDYNLDDWHKHTRTMNKAGEISWRLRTKFDPEFVTQAWCKFYENAMSFALVPPIVVDTNTLNSVHLCEAPGAFITSLNHFLKLQYPQVKWQWLATTLNPYYEGNPLSCMINDDRFILQTLDHWKFGSDFTGNLMDLDNLEDLVEDSEDLGEILLVTADGSIDCQDDPGEQETIVSSLHYCESVSALHLLAKGGSFLLKMFTMYEQDTVCLIYLLNCAFKRVNVFKPATSKEGNSEVYVVCLEYKGIEFLQRWLPKLRQHFGPTSPSKAMFPLDCIPDIFLDQLYECARMFKKLQTDVIECNIVAYTRGRGRDYTTKRLRNLIAEHFMEYYEMYYLVEEDEVVGKNKLKETVTLNLDPRTEEGSFSERRQKKALEPVGRITVLWKQLENMSIIWPWKDEDIKWLTFPQAVTGFKIQTGKPVKTVHSSKFCLGRLLNIRNEVRELANLLTPVSANTRSKTAAGQDDNPLLEMLNSRYLSMTKELTVLNFKASLWSSMDAGNNEKAERAAFKKIIYTIKDMWRTSNLLLQGYPMLTQFNVGVVYMLSHMFEKIGFIKPHKQDFGILFVSFLSINPEVDSFLDEVYQEMCELLRDGGQESVLAVLPINLLCGKQADKTEKKRSSFTEESESDSTMKSDDGERGESGSVFYTCVTEVNHLCVKEQISDIVATVIS